MDASTECGEGVPCSVFREFRKAAWGRSRRHRSAPAHLCAILSPALRTLNAPLLFAMLILFPLAGPPDKVASERTRLYFRYPPGYIEN